MTTENMFDSGVLFQSNIDPYLLMELTKINQVAAIRNE